VRRAVQIGLVGVVAIMVALIVARARKPASPMALGLRCMSPTFVEGTTFDPTDGSPVPFAVVELRPATPGAEGLLRLVTGAHGSLVVTVEDFEAWTVPAIQRLGTHGSGPAAAPPDSTQGSQGGYVLTQDTCWYVKATATKRGFSTARAEVRCCVGD
jgi:hypothetical protein